MYLGIGFFLKKWLSENETISMGSKLLWLMSLLEEGSWTQHETLGMCLHKGKKKAAAVCRGERPGEKPKQTVFILDS